MSLAFWRREAREGRLNSDKIIGMREERNLEAIFSAKSLNRIEGMRKGRRRRIPDDTAVFQNWANKGDVESNES